MDSLKNSTTLKELGLDDKNQWLLYDDKARKFFEYLSENIDNQNILSQPEIIKYEELKAAEQYQRPGYALDEELKALEAHFPGIFSITDESINEIKQELNCYDLTSEREASIERMIESEKKALIETEAIEAQLCELECQEKTLADESLQKAKILSELQKESQRLVMLLKQTYVDPQNPPTLSYQMPLEKNFQKCDQFLVSTEILIRNFNIKRSSNENNVSNSSILEMKKRIQDIQKKKFEEDLTQSGMNNIIANIDIIRNRSQCEPYEMRSVIDDIESENTALSFEVAFKEADFLLKQSEDHKMVKLFQQHLRKKNNKMLSRFDTLSKLQDLMENITLFCDLQWITLQLDLERLKNRTDNSVEIAHQVQDSIKRLRLMKAVPNHAPDESLNEFFRKILEELFTENLLTNELTTVDACLQEFIKFDRMTLITIDQTVSQKLLSQLHDAIKTIDCESDVIRKFIFNGPTNRPMINDTKYLMRIYDNEMKGNEIEKAYEFAKSTYKKNIVEPSESDKFFVMNKNLWIYFLAEPKRILECIKEVQKKAAEKKSSSLRALNVTLSRAN